MSDTDERARALARQLGHYDFHGEVLAHAVKQIEAYGRDERRRAYEEAAKVADTEISPWHTAQERLMAQQIAKAIRQQAEEEGHG